jgi:hypothetical protein
VSAARRSAVVLAALCVGAAAATAGAVPREDRPVPDEVRGCKTRGDSNRPARPPATGAVAIGPLLIWPSIRTVWPIRNASWPYATKAPKVLPARVRATLAIAPEALGTAGLWSMHGGYVSSVRFVACREREPSWGYRGTVGKYTVFPFGFALVRRSACVPMEVWLDTEAAPHRLLVPVGRSAC